MLRDIVRENLKNKTFTKDDLLKPEYILAVIDDEEDILIVNNLQNIVNFIMCVAKKSENNGFACPDMQFYCNHEIFMCTMGYYLDLVANLSYLEDIRNLLIDEQTRYEELLIEGLDTPDYSFEAIVNGEIVVYKSQE